MGSSFRSSFHWPGYTTLTLNLDPTWYWESVQPRNSFQLTYTSTQTRSLGHIGVSFALSPSLSIELILFSQFWLAHPLWVDRCEQNVGRLRAHEVPRTWFSPRKQNCPPCAIEHAEWLGLCCFNTSRSHLSPHVVCRNLSALLFLLLPLDVVLETFLPLWRACVVLCWKRKHREFSDCLKLLPVQSLLLSIHAKWRIFSRCTLLE